MRERESKINKTTCEHSYSERYKSTRQEVNNKCENKTNEYERNCRLFVL